MEIFKKLSIKENLEKLKKSKLSELIKKSKKAINGLFSKNIINNIFNSRKTHICALALFTLISIPIISKGSDTDFNKSKSDVQEQTVNNFSGKQLLDILSKDEYENEPVDINISPEDLVTSTLNFSHNGLNFFKLTGENKLLSYQIEKDTIIFSDNGKKTLKLEKGTIINIIKSDIEDNYIVLPENFKLPNNLSGYTFYVSGNELSNHTAISMSDFNPIVNFKKNKYLSIKVRNSNGGHTGKYITQDNIENCKFSPYESKLLRFIKKNGEYGYMEAMEVTLGDGTNGFVSKNFFEIKYDITNTKLINNFNNYNNGSLQDSQKKQELSDIKGNNKEFRFIGYDTPELNFGQIENMCLKVEDQNKLNIEIDPTKILKGTNNTIKYRINKKIDLIGENGNSVLVLEEGTIINILYHESDDKFIVIPNGFDIPNNKLHETFFIEKDKLKSATALNIGKYNHKVSFEKSSYSTITLRTKDGANSGYCVTKNNIDRLTFLPYIAQKVWFKKNNGEKGYMDTMKVIMEDGKEFYVSKYFFTVDYIFEGEKPVNSNLFAEQINDIEQIEFQTENTNSGVEPIQIDSDQDVEIPETEISINTDFGVVIENTDSGVEPIIASDEDVEISETEISINTDFGVATENTDSLNESVQIAIDKEDNQKTTTVATQVSVDNNFEGNYRINDPNNMETMEELFEWIKSLGNKILYKGKESSKVHLCNIINIELVEDKKTGFKIRLTLKINNGLEFKSILDSKSTVISTISSIHYENLKELYANQKIAENQIIHKTEEIERSIDVAKLNEGFDGLINGLENSMNGLIAELENNGYNGEELRKEFEKILFKTFSFGTKQEIVDWLKITYGKSFKNNSNINNSILTSIKNIFSGKYVEYKNKKNEEYKTFLAEFGEKHNETKIEIQKLFPNAPVWLEKMIQREIAYFGKDLQKLFARLTKNYNENNSEYLDEKIRQHKPYYYLADYSIKEKTQILIEIYGNNKKQEIINGINSEIAKFTNKIDNYISSNINNFGQNIDEEYSQVSEFTQTIIEQYKLQINDEINEIGAKIKQYYLNENFNAFLNVISDKYGVVNNKGMFENISGVINQIRINAENNANNGPIRLLSIVDRIENGDNSSQLIQSCIDNIKNGRYSINIISQIDEILTGIEKENLNHLRKTIVEYNIGTNGLNGYIDSLEDIFIEISYIKKFEKIGELIANLEKNRDGLREDGELLKTIELIISKNIELQTIQKELSENISLANSIMNPEQFSKFQQELKNLFYMGVLSENYWEFFTGYFMIKCQKNNIPFNLIAKGNNNLEFFSNGLIVLSRIIIGNDYTNIFGTQIYTINDKNGNKQIITVKDPFNYFEIGLNPDLIQSNKKIVRNGKTYCSATTQDNLAKLGVPRERILSGNAISLINSLGKKGLLEKIRAQELKKYLISKANEANIHDLYIRTSNGHRIMAFLGNDGEVYIFDPYYNGGNTDAVKLEEYENFEKFDYFYRYSENYFINPQTIS